MNYLKKPLFVSALITGMLCNPICVFGMEETAEAFLTRYYASLAKATSIAELEPYYFLTPKELQKRDEQKLDSKTSQFFEDLAVTLVKQEPSTVKVLAKSEEPDGKIRFSLAPDSIPQEYLEESKKPGFSMTGSAVLVRKGEEWKVYKDYWTVKTNNESGKSETNFGKDPDEEQDGEKQKGKG